MAPHPRPSSPARSDRPLEFLPVPIPPSESQGKGKRGYKTNTQRTASNNASNDSSSSRKAETSGGRLGIGQRHTQRDVGHQLLVLMRLIKLASTPHFPHQLACRRTTPDKACCMFMTRGVVAG